MLTVITPATTRKLTTVSNLRLDLGLGPTDPSDAVLNRLIDVASSAIEAYCNRVFARETVRETFDSVYGAGPVVLSRGPVLSFTSLTVGGNLYAPEDYANDAGLLYRLSSNGRVVWWGSGSFVAEYRAGYALPGAAEQTGEALPLALERAVADEVSARISLQTRDPLVRSESTEGVGSTSYFGGGTAAGSSGGLANPAVASILDAYRLVLI